MTLETDFWYAIIYEFNYFRSFVYIIQYSSSIYSVTRTGTYRAMSRNSRRYWEFFLCFLVWDYRPLFPNDISQQKETQERQQRRRKTIPSILKLLFCAFFKKKTLGVLPLEEEEEKVPSHCRCCRCCCCCCSRCCGIGMVVLVSASSVCVCLCGTQLSLRLGRQNGSI